MAMLSLSKHWALAAKRGTRLSAASPRYAAGFTLQSLTRE